MVMYCYRTGLYSFRLRLVEFALGFLAYEIMLLKMLGVSIGYLSR